MALVLKVEEIYQHLSEYDLLNPQIKQTLVYAQVMPTTGQFLLLGAYATLISGAYFVMALEEERVVLIPLHKITGKIDKKLAPIFIPREELVDVYVKEGRMMNSVSFTGEDQQLTVKLSKVVIGMAWHKENMSRFMAGIRRLEEKVVANEW
ncbi:MULTISPECIES: hypothetical protein [unclassified Jeotgalibaca]|uniref:hypothetical protein n=1 Tax=unclassified Jeotgalibaca TaxID=2621505 RepID=UPI003FCF1351